jgi:hypothetical protein
MNEVNVNKWRLLFNGGKMDVHNVALFGRQYVCFITAHDNIRQKTTKVLEKFGWENLDLSLYSPEFLPTSGFCQK